MKSQHKERLLVNKKKLHLVNRTHKRAPVDGFVPIEALLKKDPNKPRAEVSSVSSVDLASGRPWVWSPALPTKDL